MRVSSVLLSAALPALFLSACSGRGVAFPSPDTIAQNPLYLYADESLRVQYIANLQLKEPTMSGSLKTAKLQSLRAAQDAQAIIQEGWLGSFVRGQDDEVTGSVLLLDGWLHIGPSFLMTPGLDVHVYVSQMIDPLEGAFPDETAIEVGPLVTAFGMQSLPLPASVSLDGTYRTVVLYDEAVQRVSAFAQLEKAE